MSESVLQHPLITTLENFSTILDKEFDKLLPQASVSLESKLYEAMRYSVFAGGKRIRPFLTYTTANMFNISSEYSLRVAVAIELIHTYSLIHDDLPAMDNDDLRRGKPTCHKKFDEATAILAGDTLLTLAFEILSDPLTHPNSNIRCKLVSIIARASGGYGMAGGQMIDLLAEHQKLGLEDTIRLQTLKTGELFVASCLAGAILGEASINAQGALKNYAYAIGLAFQITDDILDVEGNELAAGKKLHKDSSKGKATFVELLGLAQAKEYAESLITDANKYIENFGDNAKLLQDVAKFVINRNH
jgi:farnesyl diphosphate synthase